MRRQLQIESIFMYDKVLPNQLAAGYICTTTCSPICIKSNAMHFPMLLSILTALAMFNGNPQLSQTFSNLEILIGTTLLPLLEKEGIDVDLIEPNALKTCLLSNPVEECLVIDDGLKTRLKAAISESNLKDIAQSARMALQGMKLTKVQARDLARFVKANNGKQCVIPERLQKRMHRMASSRSFTVSHTHPVGTLDAAEILVTLVLLFFGGVYFVANDFSKEHFDTGRKGAIAMLFFGVLFACAHINVLLSWCRMAASRQTIVINLQEGAPGATIDGLPV
eukprot:NODE_238_length_11959_cov_0.380270.p5 type:complete len:280 gc:universal NODE_238_length_11959_cov_0.380270:11817-10978(-)